MKSAKTNTKHLKNKKGTNINNQKAVSKMFKQKQKREHSMSAQGFYTEKHTHKFGKPKMSFPQKYMSRNCENSSNAEFSVINANNFSTQVLGFKKHRPSVDVLTKLSNNTVNNDMVTPRNKKLIPKVTLIRKLPSESNERGQSSNYRRVRVGNRKQSDIVSGIKVNLGRNASSSNRSNSVNGKFSKNEFISSTKPLKPKGKNKLVKMVSLEETKEKPFPGMLTERDPNQAEEENFVLAEDSGIPNQVYTRRQRRVQCINKLDLIDSSTMSHRGKYSHNNKENATSQY